MSRLVSVKFRGEDWDVEITHDGGYESDTNAHDLEWQFTGMTAEEYDALKITDEEETEILTQLYQISYEGYGDDYE